MACLSPLLASCWPTRAVPLGHTQVQANATVAVVYRYGMCLSGTFHLPAIWFVYHEPVPLPLHRDHLVPIAVLR